MEFNSYNTSSSPPEQIAISPEIHNKRKIKTINRKYENAYTDNCVPNTDESIINIDTDITCHEFSISTLDRKLKKLKKLKKKQAKDTNTTSKLNKLINTPSDINPIKLINEHLNEVQLRIIGHTRAANIYEKRDNCFKFPTTLLSSFTASSIMMSITMDDSDDDFDLKLIKYFSLMLSIISFFLSIFRNFLEYPKKYQSHDLSSKLYTTLFRSIKVRLIEGDQKKINHRYIFKEIVDQMSIIEQYERPVPHKLDQNIRKGNEELQLI
jgi:hypothetical protein